MRDNTQICELLDEGIDMWVAVNGKRVEKDAKSGFRTRTLFVVTGGFWEGLNGTGCLPQDIPGQWTCSLCGQERVWPTKNRCFRCGNPKHHDPVSPGPVIGPTGLELHKECLPRTRHTGERDARTRFLVNMYLRWFRQGSP